LLAVKLAGGGQNVFGHSAHFFLLDATEQQINSLSLFLGPSLFIIRLFAPAAPRRAACAVAAKFYDEALSNMAQTKPASIPALKNTFDQLRGRMDKAVEDFRNELAGMRTGRANVHMLDGVNVDAYGSQMPLNQVATVHAAEAQLITVQPWDPSQMGAIEKAIRSADLGLNPMNDGKSIRVPVPALTEERRKDMVKHLHKVLEDHRTAVRNIRRDGLDAVKKATKDKKITEDDERNGLDALQKLTDGEISKLEEMAKAKEKEVMQV
jgi:ribosome recycling factor